MKDRINFRAVQDTHVRREVGVQGVPVALYRYRIQIGNKAGHLAAGVDAGIGSACAVNPDRVAVHMFQGFFDYTLHSPIAVLDLPAVEIGTIVSQGDLHVSFWQAALSLPFELFD